MIVEIPQICWHGDRDRIMSLQFFPNSNTLVTCGGEPEERQYIKFWNINHNYDYNKDIKTTLDIDCSNKDLYNCITNIENNSLFKTYPEYDYYISGIHNLIVNIVRFSPNGLYLATAGDDHALVIWTLKKRPIKFGSSEEKVIFALHKVLRGHSGDVYDICWSSDSNHLITASIDNSFIIWNLEKGKGIISVKDHSHFVQGVAWDPLNEYVVSQSADKSLNIYSLSKGTNEKSDLKLKSVCKVKNYCVNLVDILYKTINNKENNINKDTENNNNSIKTEDILNQLTNLDALNITQNINNDLNNISKINNEKVFFNYFASESQHPGFVRRLEWSNDGEFLLAVAGIYQEITIENNYNNKDNIINCFRDIISFNKPEHVVWGFMRRDLNTPAFMLPTLSSPTCVKFCPVIFKKSNTCQNNNNDLNKEIIDLDYKLVFAVGTKDSVLVYDTQSIVPRYVISNVHVMQITDLSWSTCNNVIYLAASSSDGYISFFYFDYNSKYSLFNMYNIDKNITYLVLKNTNNSIIHKDLNDNNYKYICDLGEEIEIETLTNTMLKENYKRYKNINYDSIVSQYDNNIIASTSSLNNINPIIKISEKNSKECINTSNKNREINQKSNDIINNDKVLNKKRIKPIML